MPTVAEYEYIDKDGTVCGKVERVEPGREGRRKEFFPHHFDGSKFVLGLNGKQFPLYHADEVAQAIADGQTIFFVEGEGKADALRAALRAANSRAAVTTIAGGCKSPLGDEHLAALKGAPKIVFLIDSDAPGRASAKARADVIARRYPETDVRVIDLFADRDDGSDVADWLRERHKLRELAAIITAAPICVPEPPLPTAIQKPQGKSADFMLAYDFAAQADGDVTYLVERLLAAGGTFAVIAKPKVGKSTLALSLSLAVARGDEFLGRATRQGSVLYVALEGSAGEWKRVLRALGVQPDDAFHFFHGKRPEAVGPWLRAAVEKYQPALIVFDTLQRLVKVKDISDYAALSNATDDLIELARSSGATLGFLHHGGKSEKSDPIDSPLGSTAIGGAVDALLYLKRGATNRTLQTVQRDGNDLPETIIVMDPNTHHVSLGGTKAEADESDVSRAICEYLAGLTESITEAVILENVEGRKSLKQATLRRLVAGGALKRSGAGKSGSPYLYAQAVETNPECLPPLPPTTGREVEKQTFEIGESSRQTGVFSTSGILGSFERADGSASKSGGTLLTDVTPAEHTSEPIDL